MTRRRPALADSLREAARSLARARLRTLLGLVGIMIGIASVIAMVSTAEIATAESRRQFEALGTDIVTVRVKGGSETRGIGLDVALELADALPAIAEAAPILRAEGGALFAGQNVARAVQGVSASMASVGRLELADGRFVSDLDIRQFWSVVGAKAAERMRLQGAWEIVGESIDIGDHVFTIAGELRTGAAGFGLPVQLDADESVFIPITTAQRMAPDRKVRSIIARAAPGVFHEDAVREVTVWLEERLEEGVRIDVKSARQLIAQMEKQLGLMTLLLGAVGSIALIVGGIGVMNIMLISLSERRREIGVRRALGASRRDIQRQFLIEAVILTVCGGVAGVAVGTGATWGICQFTAWDFFVSPTSVAIGVGVSTLIGVFFGFHPAYQAARVDPIAALQGE